MDNPLRGEIWWVDFDPTEGSETGKTRPAVVISDEQLGRLLVRVVMPITGWNESYRGYVWSAYRPAEWIKSSLEDDAAR